MHNQWLVKAVILGGITVVFIAVLSYFHDLVSDRDRYREQARQSIVDSWSGSQYLLGPILHQPYQIKTVSRRWDEKLKQYQQQETLSWRSHYTLAKRVDIAAGMHTEQRQLGIYQMPVYTSTIRVDGAFELAEFAPALAANESITSIGQPELQLAISDVRGLNTPSVAEWQSDSIEFLPGSQFEPLPDGMHAAIPKASLQTGQALNFAIEFDLRGSQALEFLLSGHTTNVTLQSDWPHPGFDGRHAPVSREIDADGFHARWSVSSLAGNTEELLQSCQSGECGRLLQSGFRVNLVDPVDLQQIITRALKYGILFIGLTYIAFFLFEITSGQLLHPIQYALVGSALVVFYLLLTALSEHLAFWLAYALSSAACASLLGVYLQAIMPRRWQAWLQAAATFALYWLLYVILRSEDTALLMGSVLVFTALAVVMLLTRKLDWYRFGHNIRNNSQRADTHAAERSDVGDSAPSVSA